MDATVQHFHMFFSSSLSKVLHCRIYFPFFPVLEPSSRGEDPPVSGRGFQDWEKLEKLEKREKREIDATVQHF